MCKALSPVASTFECSERYCSHPHRGQEAIFNEEPGVTHTRDTYGPHLRLPTGQVRAAALSPAGDAFPFCRGAIRVLAKAAAISSQLEKLVIPIRHEIHGNYPPITKVREVERKNCQ